VCARMYDLSVRRWLQLNGFSKFCLDANFPDVKSKFCKPKDIDLIFVAVNVEVNSKTDEDLMNPDRALMRFEFLDALLRIAYRKFVMVRHGIFKQADCLYLLEQQHARNRLALLQVWSADVMSQTGRSRRSDSRAAAPVL
jgi:hypothetical protein